MGQEDSIWICEPYRNMIIMEANEYGGKEESIDEKRFSG
jgi:hypothetical protein